ncbi:hypothetical protein FA95DRAFT_418268 [Auriscalpium vulgare]|uniref:Uncharacterized protein n=1 Tax=Auriscalpium vulgare TaxID=40419 RepID=A0ACB8S4D5_9AGAM|nr:hypothetical protein FA95DRAFT_418268 [Auriscalpium vulgare]
MVALSPRFTLLAALCALAALSSGPSADAAAIHMRGNVNSTSAVAYMGTTTAHAHSASASSDVQAKGDPVVPLPKGGDTPAVKKGDSDVSGGTKSKAKGKDKDGGKKDDDSGDDDSGDDDSGDDDSGDDDDKDSKKSKKASKDKDRRHYYDFLDPLIEIGGFRIGDKRHHDHHPEVIIKGKNDHVHVARAPSPKHHHHHHHPHHRAVEEREPRHHHHHHGRDPHREHVVVISGDHEKVHLARDPHWHHDHWYGHEHEKVVVSGNNDDVHLRRDPHWHHGDRHGHEKIVVSGNDDKVHLKRHVLISGEKGESYVVAREANPKRARAQHGFAMPDMFKRGTAAMDGVPGHIDIVSPVANAASNGQRIASLVLAANNATSSADPTAPASNVPFVMNASENNQTQIFLVPAPTSSTMTSALAPGEVLVNLQMPVFDASTATVKAFCATFDPNPPAPGPLTAAQCTNGSSEDTHASQGFAFNPMSGAVRPMWYSGQDDGTDDSSAGAAPPPTDDGTDGDIDPGTPQSAFVASVTDVEPDAPDSSSTSASAAQAFDATSALPSATDTTAAPAATQSASGQFASAQNVTLVFTADEPEIEPGVEDVTSTVDATYTWTSTSTSVVVATATAAAADVSDSAEASTSTSGTVLAFDFSSLAATTTTDFGAFAVPTASDASDSTLSSYPSVTDAAFPIPLASPSSSSDVPDSSAPPIGAFEFTSSLPVSPTPTPSPSPSPVGALGVQVVPEGTPSSASTAAAPTMTPVSTAPYEWMFSPDN